MLLANFERRLPAFTLRAAFMVETGATLVLWGESGAGKTSILATLAGLERPDRGEISLSGHLLHSTRRGIDLPPRLRRIGYVFQDYALFPHLSALDNLLFALRAARGRRSAGRPAGALSAGGGGEGIGRPPDPAPPAERARALLERFGLSSLAARRPAELSGGERQRLAFARALAGEPELLLLDEPWSALDRSTRAEAQAEFLRFRAEWPVTTVLVTHDRSEAERFGRDIHEVRSGEVVL